MGESSGESSSHGHIADRPRPRSGAPDLTTCGDQGAPRCAESAPGGHGVTEASVESSMKDERSSINYIQLHCYTAIEITDITDIIDIRLWLRC